MKKIIAVVLVILLSVTCSNASITNDLTSTGYGHWILGSIPPTIGNSGPNETNYIALGSSSPFYWETKDGFDGEGSVVIWIYDSANLLDFNQRSGNGPYWGLQSADLGQIFVVGIFKNTFNLGNCRYSAWSSASAYSYDSFGYCPQIYSAGWYKWTIDGTFDDITFTMHNALVSTCDGAICRDEPPVIQDIVETYNTSTNGGMWAGAFGYGWSGIALAGDSEGIENFYIQIECGTGVFTDVGSPENKDCINSKPTSSSMADQGNLWSVDAKTMYSSSMENYITYGDTIINLKKYAKVYVFYNDTVISTSAQVSYFGAIRENYSDQVFFRGIYDTMETMAYDFSLAAGDTFHQFSYYRVVTQIDSILIDGKYKKRYYFDNWNEPSWIEDIGSVYGPFRDFKPKPTCGCSHPDELICVKKDNEVIYLNSKLCELCFCGYGLAIDQPVEINSNPTNGIVVRLKEDGILVINKTTNERFRVSLVSITGETLTAKDLRHDIFFRYKLTPPGIYFLRIQGNDINEIRKVVVVR